jgi:phosphodiester glycosidase
MTSRYAFSVAAVVLAACGSSGTPRQPTGTPYDSAFSEQVAPGVVHRRLVAMHGPFTINVVEVDLRRRDIAVEAVHAFDSLRGRERPTAMVARVSAGTPVIAAVNADFFDLKTGENENNQVVNGDILKGVAVTDSPFDSLHTIHTQFGMTCSAHPVMERFAFTGAVLTPPPSAVLPLQAINYRPRGDATVLYTASYGITPADSAGGLTVETPLRLTSRHGDTMLYQSAGAPHEGGGTVLRRGEAVLAGTGAAAEVVRRLGASIGPNNNLRIVGRFTPDRGRLCTLVGGWPRIVLNGRSIADSVDRLEGTFPRFSLTRHPRTGVGFSRDSTMLYLVTVDGRSESSSGMSLAELATFMQSIGIFQGLNLDGGGSTSMVVRGVLANHPSDSTGERSIGDALLIERHSSGARP